MPGVKQRDSTEKTGQVRPGRPSGVSQTAYSAVITEEGVRCPLSAPCVHLPNANFSALNLGTFCHFHMQQFT